MQKLKTYLGKTDIYLLDQITKGRFLPEHQILDAGCGKGRNLYWFAQNGYPHLFGVDQKPDCIRGLKVKYSTFADNLKVSNLENMPFEDEQFDRIICSAVLHFAKSEAHFWEMIAELWRVLKPEGILFIRMTAIFGLEKSVKLIGKGVYQIPDGTNRFLLTRGLMNEWENRFPFDWLEPFKWVNVNDERVMSTLVIKKGNTPK